MDEGQKVWHGTKASVPIVVGVAWVAVAVLFLLSSAGFSIPRWMPLSLVIPTFVAIEVLLFLGWLIPLAAGICLLTKRR
jgi:predicted branched-subunit amino acid permease